ncbi:glycosyl hydrolase family 31 [Trichoderma arundinaceum]|uniref:Glycosyl hydrolase family 31 n=1 Tax=Trichoderma arundinaceum TaxID=490622 RepID=A0A395NJU7_TRIAR|nr:glycosyl hydrolase family 31 [Trichoderma arundinaceum]
MVGFPGTSRSFPPLALALAVVVAIVAMMVHWKAALFAGLTSAAAIFKRDDAATDSLAQCPGYTASNVHVTSTAMTADLTLAGDACNVYGTDLPNLILQVTYQTEDRIHVLIQDKDNQVYQVPESVFPRPGGSVWSQSSNLKFSYTASPFSFKITRAKTGEVIFDTSPAPLVFESQYLRLRTSLPVDPYLYGLGEHSDPLRLKTSNYIRTMWNQDSYGIPSNANLYGTHPFYLEQRDTGAHGVFFLNSNGMDILINKDASGNQYLEYNTIGGVFDFYFVAGPTPVAAVQQYGEFAGFATMQPYWGLGFHQCRYGYRDAFDVAEVVQNYSLANIPLETMWTDIDYMDRRRVFTLDPARFPLSTMRDLVSHLHDHDQHYVVMVDPAVAYQDYAPANQGLEDNVFMLRSNGSVWIGVVWPGVTVFPDWFSANITQYWNGQFQTFFDAETGLDIDALWIDMNEPSNFPCNFPCDDPYKAAQGYPPAPPPVRAVPRPLPGWPCEFQPGGCPGKRDAKSPALQINSGSGGLPVNVKSSSVSANHKPASGKGDQKGLPGRDLLYPKYAIHNKAAFQDSWNADKGGISNHTVNTDLIHQNGLAMYDTHNLYGTMMSTASHDAMLARRPGLRPLVITRSTFAGAGSKVGHWLGDNRSQWSYYTVSIRTMLAFTSLFQFGFVGSDVCGFGGNTNEELCARWASLGAFNTFYRNHNDLGNNGQEFYRWPSVASSARKAIDIRYRLLDYIYTALYRQSTDGTPAVTPMFFKYPNDKATWALELQYFFGPGIVVAPVTQQGSTSVSVYLPDDVFYDWYTHARIDGGATNHVISNVDITSIPLFIRGGVILPLRVKSANTTTELRKQNFELLIALDGSGSATGELYLDDGVSIEQRATTHVTFTYKNGIFILGGSFSLRVPFAISKVTILGGKSAFLKSNSGSSNSQTFNVNLPFNGPTSIRIG